jgi:hypothetical protein
VGGLLLARGLPLKRQRHTQAGRGKTAENIKRQRTVRRRLAPAAAARGAASPGLGRPSGAWHHPHLCPGTLNRRSRLAMVWFGRVVRGLPVVGAHIHIFVPLEARARFGKTWDCPRHTCWVCSPGARCLTPLWPLPTSWAQPRPWPLARAHVSRLSHPSSASSAPMS